MPNYIPSGGIVNGQIILAQQVKNIIEGLSGANYDINAGSGILFVSGNQNVGINTLTPNSLYKLVVNGAQLNNNDLRISGSNAKLYVNFLTTSSAATNIVTYNTSTGQLFTTGATAFLGNYIQTSQTGSFLTTASLTSLNTITFTKGNGTTFPLTINTGSVSGFATTSSNNFSGSQIITGSINISNNLTANNNIFFPNIPSGIGGNLILTYNSTTGQVFYISPDQIVPSADFSGYLLIDQTSSMLAPYVLNSRTASFATTGSNRFNGNQIITGSLLVSGGLTTLFNTVATGSFTGSFTGSLLGTSSFANTASFALTSSYVNIINGNNNISVDYNTNPGAITIGGSIGVANGGSPAIQANSLNFGAFISASVELGIATINVSSSILGGVQLYDNGADTGQYFALNFGDNISVTNSGSGVANVIGTIKIFDEGVPEAADIRALNFIGTGVDVTTTGTTASITFNAGSGINILQNGTTTGTIFALDILNPLSVAVAGSPATASISLPGGVGGGGSVAIQSSSVLIVPTASIINFTGSGVSVSQSSTNTALITISGGSSVSGVTGNIQYNSGSTLQGATTFNFISSSNHVQLTGSLIVSNSAGGVYILSSSGVVFSSSLYTTGSIFFTGLSTISPISNILTYDSSSGQLYYTSSDEYQRVKVKFNSNITSSRMLEFTGSGVSVTFASSTASINIPSYINPGPTGYLAFYSGSTSQSLHPVSASSQVGVFWDITNQRLGINKITPEYTLEVSGSFGATTKSFIVPHKTQEGKYLQYGVTEGPEHSVFVRGKSNSHIIELPEEWDWLVDQDTITVNLTSVGEYQNLHILDIIDNKVIVGSNTSTPNFHYQIFAERKDVPKLKTII